MKAAVTTVNDNSGRNAMDDSRGWPARSGLPVSRREFLAGTAAVLAAGRGGLVNAARAAADNQLRVLRFGAGVRSIGPLNINFLIGEALGYNRQEGFRVEHHALGTNSNVIAALGQGEIDVGVTSLSFLLPPYVKGQLPPIMNFFEHTYPFKYDVVVKPDSPIGSYEDLRGKKIGVADLGTSDYPMTRALLAGIGIDPTKDVASWIAVGNGVQAGVALERGVIDALAYYDTGFGEIEAAGIKFRTLPRPAKIPMIGGLYLGSLRSLIEKDRALVVGYGRSVAKAEEFIMANPRAGAKVFLDMYPDLKKRNASMDEAIDAILFPVKRRMRLWPPPYANTKKGFIREEDLREEADFVGVQVADFKPLYTNALIDEINDFDVEAIRKEAREYPV